MSTTLSTTTLVCWFLRPSVTTVVRRAVALALLLPSGSLTDGVYDEAEQSRLFQQSVMEWRKARAASKGEETTAAADTTTVRA